MTGAEAAGRWRSSIVSHGSTRSPGFTEQPWPKFLVRERPDGWRDIDVIGDRFKEVPDAQHGDVILEALRRVEGESLDPQRSCTLGLRADEAAAIGLLPYAVVARRREADS